MSTPTPEERPEVAAGRPAAPAGPAAATQPANPPAVPPVGAWRRLVRAMRPRSTTAQLLAGLLCALLGFAIAVQVRQTDTSALSSMRESDLISLLDQTTRQADELQDQVTDLEQTRQELQSGSSSREAALEAATRSAAVQGILSGRLPAEGPGVTITVTDPAGTVSALTLLNLLEELRNAGAEAVQLGDLRLTAQSYFLATDDGIEVDGVLTSPPYRWIAIGDAETIATALSIPGGALAKVQVDGGNATVQQQDEVEVSATRTPVDPEYASPVDPEDG
ncbi:MAG TPA: DUF881 domain-containing protein [Cellulomonas sp.]